MEKLQEELKEFAKEIGFSFTFKEKDYDQAIYKGIQHRISYVLIKKDEASPFYLACRDSKSLSEESRLFSGFFFAVNASQQTKITLQKKDVLDKLSIFGKKKKQQLGVQSFDSNFICTSNDAKEIARFFSLKETHQQMLDAAKIKTGIHFGINPVHIPSNIQDVLQKSYFAVYKHDWIVDKNILIPLLEKTQEIQKQISSL